MKLRNWLLISAIAAGGCLAEEAPEPGDEATPVEQVSAGHDAPNLELQQFLRSNPVHGDSFTYTEEAHDADGNVADDVITVRVEDSVEMAPEDLPADGDLDAPVRYNHIAGTRTLTCEAMSSYTRAERTAVVTSCWGYKRDAARNAARALTEQDLAESIRCRSLAGAAPGACTAAGSVAFSPSLVGLSVDGPGALPAPNASPNLCARDAGSAVSTRRGALVCGGWIRTRSYITTAAVKSTCGARCG